MTIENLEKDLKSEKLDSIYFFYGEELFLLENSLKKVKKLFGECMQGINYVTIDESNVSGLIDNIETPSFGYEKKLIVVRDSGLLKKDGRKKSQEITELREKVKKYIEENIETIKKSCVIIFIEEETDSRLGLYKTIDKLGVVCKFDYQKPIQIQKRLKAICNAYKVNVDDATLKYLIECSGTNMQELMNEIRKLIEYAGNGGKIKNEDVDKLAIKKLESVIFDLTDSLGKKNVATALQVLQNLIYAKEPIQKILITLYNHFRKLYFVKIALKNQMDIVAVLNLKPNQMFLTNKYRMQANSFEELELKEILQELRDLDYNYKNGKIDLQVGLETIMCKYC